MGFEMKIRDSRTDGDKLKQFVDIWADSASDIPTAKTDWVAGSIAFAIDTGVFYVLNSSGVWVNQNQDDSSVLSTVSTNSVSPAVSPSVLDRNKELLSGVQADVETLEEPEVEEVEHETVGLDEGE